MLPAGVTPPPGFYPANYYTDDEKAAEARWMRWGSDCIQKIGRKWDSTVPQAPLFATKREALAFLTHYVTEALPLRALERYRRRQDAPQGQNQLSQGWGRAPV